MSESNNKSRYVSTPGGILTSTGVWFRATEESIREFAGDVLERESLDILIDRAERWIVAHKTTAIWVFVVLLSLIDPFWITAAATALLLVVVRVLAPSFGGKAGADILKVLDYIPLQFVAYLVLLSLFGFRGDTIRLAVGLAGFIVLRWNLVDVALRKPLNDIHNGMYGLPRPDQILRSVIVKSALRNRIELPELQKLERSVLRALGQKDRGPD